MMTHCRRELFQGVWFIFLDKEFVRAWKNGIIVMFPDGVVRRVFLRIITYAADYLEK